MAIYEYKCRGGCGFTVLIQADRNDKPKADTILDSEICTECGSVEGFRPYYGSVGFGQVMHSHFNSTTGTLVSSPRGFERELSRMSNQAEEKTGIPHNYQPVDPMDKEALNVTDEGLASTHDQAVKDGRIDPTPRLL